MSARGKDGAEEEERKEGLSEEEEDEDEVFRIKPEPPKHQTIPNIPESMDDFLRNFLLRLGLRRTLSSFESEWYDSAQKVFSGTLPTPESGVFFLPDALTHQKILQTELETVRRETELLRMEVLTAGENLTRMQRERNFHRLQHRRVVEDKNQLIKDLKHLKEHLKSYEPAMKQLEDKHQVALRQKMLLSLQKDRVQNATEAKVNQEKAPEKKSPVKIKHLKDSEFPVYSRMVKLQVDQVTSEAEKSLRSFSLQSSIKAHQQPISCIDLHPKEMMLVSVSDDCRWRMWRLETGEKVGEMMLTGEGHSDWLSGCSFYPDGTKLATTSGDTTVRLWNFSLGCCVLTFFGHSQPTWSCSFHSSGRFLASCSSDRTAKLWDLNSQRCRLTLRRHDASVNSVHFLSSSNLLLTASADKTVVLWDTRLAVCPAVFTGHRHPCNHATSNMAADLVASCDSGGVVNIWDSRKPVTPLAAVDVGPMGANQVVFSQSGKALAVASGDGSVRLVELESCEAISLDGHNGSVQSVKFDHKGTTVMSAGSDGRINVWS
ncbi:sperm-associated antigen 16 protein [Amphiprion ocellaris]|uniref:sperm-associated antigen 16 protein n=1 Tax=Amphiprion ocellaris TaxID=80972 RepID=UPI0024114B5F|nr:sperm-associated antigen 16 protein [Amphiprion ocellaris]